MKMLTVAVFVLTHFTATSVFAAGGPNGGHLGIKTGTIDVDISAFDVEMPIGIVFGTEKGQLGVDFELVYAKTEFSYSVNYYNGSTSRTSSSDFKSIAVYGVYRSEGDVFFKVKGGILGEEIGSATDVGLSVGIGGGVRTGNISLEAEFTMLDADANFLSIGLNFNL